MRWMWRSRASRGSNSGPGIPTTCSFSTSCCPAATASICAARSDPALPFLSSCSLRSAPIRIVSSASLLLTARDTVQDKVSGLDLGADDYLTKPFAFAELLVRVRALLRRGGPQLQARLTAADLELDPATHRVWRGGTEIFLTNKEYALLDFLLRNKNRVLTRTAIIEHVWDISYDPMTNIVDAHIRALRAKIDRAYSPPLIVTVRGAGYMLEEEDHSG